jgi:peroxiredoxin
VPKTIQHIKKVKAWQRQYDAQAPKVGDLAPDFKLSDINSEHDIRLSDFREKKPVALIFGSFT